MLGNETWTAKQWGERLLTYLQLCDWGLPESPGEAASQQSSISSNGKGTETSSIAGTLETHGEKQRRTSSRNLSMTTQYSQRSSSHHAPVRQKPLNQD
ncbi:hypothetical protein B0T26DRAFT_730408 [Lasiosphaeria miniovina]|uniref:Uncharacterized protein n=1 Tax=Lasiosphaeria miniovina TaxID=1954250 RepID=A0AA40DJP2_9PEZI|nr:uncharacterized protein B0T26DRAFT_730408 [Lasiosphaeria miniovina]KAK0703237.1 hypothetical protein B0T26DRAFT_730408 [Lasiosphaeria miniovina]